MKYLYASFVCALIGTFSNCIAYEMLQPIISLLIVYAVFFFMGLANNRLSLRNEFQMLIFLFSFFWMISGVSAIYAELFKDQYQVTSDAANFYTLSSGESDGLELLEIQKLTEGAAVVIVWRKFYNIFHWFGLEKMRYIGVLLNCIFVAAAGFVTIKTAHHIYGRNQKVSNNIVVLFCCCSLFWLYATIHVRDSAILLSISLLCFFWTRYIVCKGIINFIIVMLMSVLGMYVLFYLRAEFILVPVVLFLTYIISVTIFNQYGFTKRIFIYAAFIVVAISVAFFVYTNSSVISLYQEGRDMYKELAGNEIGQGGSLGYSLVVSAPFPLRMVIGPLYMFIFPIPFWSGFFAGSAYELYVSLNAFFLYTCAPLLFLAVSSIFRKQENRRPVLLFHVLVCLGFCFGVGLTSLEIRHFGVFWSSLIIVVLLPLLNNKDKNKRNITFLFYFAAIAFIHTVWAILKFVV